MAETVTFGMLLTDRIGLTNATRNAIQDQGVATLEELADLDYDMLVQALHKILHNNYRHHAYRALSLRGSIGQSQDGS
jgi:hypothetical protein